VSRAFLKVGAQAYRSGLSLLEIQKNRVFCVLCGFCG
jgi:hypothetical protein